MMRRTVALLVGLMAAISLVLPATPAASGTSLQPGEHVIVTGSTLDELLQAKLADGSIPNRGIATSIAKQAAHAPLDALERHLVSLVGEGVISAETMHEIVALLRPSDGYTLVKEGVLTVGTSPDFPPFESVGPGGQLEGFDVDMIKEIANRLGLDCEFKTYAFDDLIPALVSGGEMDVIASGLSITEAREEIVDFSDAYYSASSSDHYGFAFNESNPLLRDAVNDALAAMVADGSYDAIYEKWF